MKKLDKLKIANDYYPNAKIELNYKTNFQLLVAVMLSAQTTDKAVNAATKKLFTKYYEAKDFVNLTYEYLYGYLKKIGLGRTKTKNLIKLAYEINTQYSDKIPDDRKLLMELSGVGQKTANVVLANVYNKQYIAVDTHIERICKRLAITPENYNVLEVEKTLERVLKQENLNNYHHGLIFFGRYHCKARNPQCEECKLKNECRYYKNRRKNEI